MKKGKPLYKIFAEEERRKKRKRPAKKQHEAQQRISSQHTPI